MSAEKSFVETIEWNSTSKNEETYCNKKIKVF